MAMSRPPPRQGQSISPQSRGRDSSTSPRPPNNDPPPPDPPRQQSAGDENRPSNTPDPDLVGLTREFVDNVRGETEAINNLRQLDTQLSAELQVAWGNLRAALEREQKDTNEIVRKVDEVNETLARYQERLNRVAKMEIRGPWYFSKCMD